MWTPSDTSTKSLAVDHVCAFAPGSDDSSMLQGLVRNVVCEREERCMFHNQQVSVAIEHWWTITVTS